jgi:hypothetical protein
MPGLTPIVDGTVMWDIFTPTRSTSADDERQRVDLPHSEQQQHQQQQHEHGVMHMPTTASPRKIALSGPKDCGDDEQGRDDEARLRDAKFALYQGRVLGRYLLWDIWVRLESRYDCKAVWEADGQVNKIRLKRALVGLDHYED